VGINLLIQCVPFRDLKGEEKKWGALCTSYGIFLKNDQGRWQVGEKKYKDITDDLRRRSVVHQAIEYIGTHDAHADKTVCSNHGEVPTGKLLKIPKIFFDDENRLKSEGKPQEGYEMVPRRDEEENPEGNHHIGHNPTDDVHLDSCLNTPAHGFSRGKVCLSTRRTFAPCSERKRAAVEPAGPAPTITTS
jgi:hypothetical protein